jgi:hypothetical protein
VWQGWSNGERYRGFEALTIVAYGLLMELIAFNYWQNYAHAQFTVQLYNGLLPLYIVFVYPVFHYLGLYTVKSARLGPVPEALAAGAAICLVDVPFDIVGVRAGWWVWASADASIAPGIYEEAVRTRWLGVPVTSYLWYLSFGAILAGLLRAARSRVERLPTWAWLPAAVALAASVIVLGVLSFQVTFWLPRLVGVSDHLIVATVGAVGVGAGLFGTRGSTDAAPGVVRGAVTALQAFMVLVMLWCTWQGAVARPVAVVCAGLAAIATSWALGSARAEASVTALAADAPPA